MTTLYEDRRYKVIVNGAGGLVRTPRASHDLSKISSVSLRRTPFYLALTAAVGVIGFVLGWWRYFEPDERGWLLGLAVGTAVVASQIAVLRVDSVAITEPEMGTTYGLWWRLRSVRAAIEKAMAKNFEKERTS